jgi:hypothetical protein
MHHNACMRFGLILQPRLPAAETAPPDQLA